MNFTTHVMFGILLGVLFFGKPEIILLVGIGAAIPDLDREYGFLSEESFRSHQVHRAFCHNFVFLGLLYLVNPFLALGAFSHTLLDALTTAKDRGVEWLFPFTRFVKRALYDEHGNRLPSDPNKKGRVYFYQYDIIQLTRKASKDLREYKSAPWRRTYGPALSGGTLDLAVFVGSLALVILLVAFTKLGLHDFIDLATRSIDYNFYIPLLIGSIGIVLELGLGEVDRRREEKNLEKPSKLYRALFGVSVVIMVSAIALGAYLNPAASFAILSFVPFFAAGAVVTFLAAVLVIELYSRGVIAKYAKKRKKGHGGDEDEDDDEPEDIAVI